MAFYQLPSNRKRFTIFLENGTYSHFIWNSRHKTIQISFPKKYSEYTQQNVEIIQHIQLSRHLEKYSIIPECQYEVRSKHSCTTAILKETDGILSIPLIFIPMDSPKALDKTKHNLLISKSTLYWLLSKSSSNIWKLCMR